MLKKKKEQFKKEKVGEWSIPKPAKYRPLEEEDYIPTGKDPDMKIILGKEDK